MTAPAGGATPELVFARHGETDWNVAGRLQGQTDIPLNARGRDQAEAVGRALIAQFPGIGAGAFVASPLSRATETARLMRAAMGLEPEDFETDDRLRELSFGRWEGSTFRDIRDREPGVMTARAADRWGHRPPGGESYADVRARLKTCLDARAGPLVLVAHGGVCRALLALRGAVSTADLPEMRIPQGRALVFEGESWRWT